MRINADLTKILGKEHEEKWVALSKDRKKLVDSSENLVELRDRLCLHASFALGYGI